MLESNLIYRNLQLIWIKISSDPRYFCFISWRIEELRIFDLWFNLHSSVDLVIICQNFQCPKSSTFESLTDGAWNVWQTNERHECSPWKVTGSVPCGSVVQLRTYQFSSWNGNQCRVSVFDGLAKARKLSFSLSWHVMSRSGRVTASHPLRGNEDSGSLHVYDFEISDVSDFMIGVASRLLSNPKLLCVQNDCGFLCRCK